MKFNFPKDFSFGSSFSGPQTEGMIDKKALNIFEDDCKKNPSRYYNQMQAANNFYQNYKKDIELAKKMGLDELRTSIQGSRLMPDGKNIDNKAVQFYNNVIDSMIANGIKPTFALYHFDMPVGAQKMGGGENREVVNLFVEYAKKAFSLFGKKVKVGFTFNEPIVPVEAGYLKGLHPPYIKNAKKAMQVQWNTLIAHHMCVKEYRKMNLKGIYGAIINFAATIPASNSDIDKEASELSDMAHGRCFTDPMFLGEYPKKFEKKLKEAKIMFKEEEGDRELIKNNLVTYFGINYYGPAFAKGFTGSIKKGELDEDGMPKMYENYTPPFILMNSSRGWPVYPYGIYKSIMKVKELYGENVVMYISENGMGVENEDIYRNASGKIQDDYRILFFKMHLAFVSRAIKEGANVRGFHSGGYLDNGSGNNAYKNRYGSIELELTTGQRKEKKSAEWGRNVSKNKYLEIDDFILKSPFLKPFYDM